MRLTGERYEADRCTGCRAPDGRCWCAMTSTASGGRLPREALARAAADLWRYRELLPVRRPENVLSLGEVVTPLVSLPRSAQLGGGEMLVKDEGRLPTGSFKARGLVLAVSMAKELGVTTWRCRPTAMPARRWRPIARAPASRRPCSAPTTRRGECARDRDAGRRRCSSSTG